MQETKEQKELPHITDSEQGMRMRMKHEGWRQEVIDMFFDRSPIMGSPARIPREYVQIGRMMVMMAD